MKLVDILKIESIKIPLASNDKDSIIKELVELVTNAIPLADFNSIHNAVCEREKTMSTGIGQGVAIPHCKTEGVTEISAALGIVPDGIDFDSLDGEPTKLFFLLISPESPAGPHLRCLSRISRLLNREEFRIKLTNASSPKEALSIIEEEEKQFFEIK